MRQRYRKITLRLYPEQEQALTRMLEWGQRDPLFRRFIDALTETVETHGPGILEDLTSGRASIGFEAPSVQE